MESPTQTLHRLTSVQTVDLARLWGPPVDDPRVLDFKDNDLTRFPWFYKRYPQPLPAVPLPRDLPATSGPAAAVLAGTADIPAAELSLPQLSRLLHLSAGVVRSGERPYARRYLFRAAGSAGGRFPLEVYVAVPDGTRLPAGVHWYHPEEHALVRVGPPPRGGVAAIIVTGIPWRTGWRYRERGYRHVYWDAGTMLAQVLAVAGSAGLTAALHSRFPDAQVTGLVGADGVHEWPVAVVALGDGPPALTASGPAAAGAVDAAPAEFGLITSAQRAGDRDELGAAWERGAPARISVQQTRPVEAVVLARGSQRRMDPGRGLPASTLRDSMRAALRGIPVPHHVVVHDVTGMAPGVYRWPDLDAPVRRGALREEVYQVCMEQRLGSDAAFVVIGSADLAKLDDREYREAHLAAGVAEGRLHLFAYACGASASGMTFVDGMVPGLLGEPLNGLLFTCVGVPEYASTAGGPPGAPVLVRTLPPRED